MTVFDELAETDGDNEFRTWVSKLIDAKHDIATFVTQRLQSNIPGEFDGYLKGSFNLSRVIKLGDDRKAVIRFPKPGHTATTLREEKVRNEVLFLDYLREKTKIPVPLVLDWGVTDESPCQLGPFLIMNYVHGTTLSTLLKEPTETDQDEVILATDIDETKLQYVYEQVADYMLQLSQLDLDAIGAISRNASNDWTVSGRPLTYNMNELATVVSNYPRHDFPTAPFASARAFLHHLADEHLVHLKTQRNLADTREDARKRFIARHRFKQLIEKYLLAPTDAGPFKPYCDDFRPTNMLADPETYTITADLNFEFSNALPAQFAYDPPWWLLLLGPDMWLEHHSKEEFDARFVPRMHQFIQAMETVETKQILEKDESPQTSLSARMRESWESKQFWFDYGIRKSFDVDAVYWAALHEPGQEKLDEDLEDEMEAFVNMKMEQLEAYEAECRTRFSK